MMGSSQRTTLFLRGREEEVSEEYVEPLSALRRAGKRRQALVRNRAFVADGIKEFEVHTAGEIVEFLKQQRRYASRRIVVFVVVEGKNEKGR